MEEKNYKDIMLSLLCNTSKFLHYWTMEFRINKGRCIISGISNAFDFGGIVYERWLQPSHKKNK